MLSRVTLPHAVLQAPSQVIYCSVILLLQGSLHILHSVTIHNNTIHYIARLGNSNPSKPDFFSTSKKLHPASDRLS